MTLTRRFTLGALAAAGCNALPKEEGPRSSQFPYGVAVGDPSSNGGLLWTRYLGTDSLRVDVWPRAEPMNVRSVEASVMEHGISLVTVDGLQSGQWYSYAFVAHRSGVEVDRSDEGRFRTALAPGVSAPLRFGVSSCSRQTYPLAPLTRISQEFECDAFLFLGDTVYADGATDLPSYREKWAEALTRRPQRLLRQSTGIISTWDDHEIVNDASGDRVPTERLEAARRATFEHQPWRADMQAPLRLWRSLKFGATAEVFVLDCRSERSRSRNEYVSRAQLDWLKSGLAASTAVFKLVLNSVPITNYPGAFFQAFAPDRWEGFPDQRREVLEFIDTTPISGLLWLTGDFHMGVAGRVSRDGVGSKQVELAAGPAGQFANPSLSYPSGPQFDFSSAVNNAVVLDLDPATTSARVQFLDGGTRTLFDKTYDLSR